MATNLNESRIASGDILTVKHLSRAPAVLIDLVRKLAPDDVETPPTVPLEFPNPLWDNFKARRERAKDIRVRKALYCGNHDSTH